MDRREDWPISGINIVVSRIDILDEVKISQGSATGFFFKHNDVEYLITNRHVVIDESDNFYPKYLRLQLHLSRTVFNQNCCIDISLYDNDSINWLEHPDYAEKQIDVIAIPLTKRTIDNINNFNRSIINFFTIDNFNSEYQISSFADVLIIGYPLGFSDEVNNLPVYRKGMIASSYPIHFENYPYFLIDSNLHEGTSGSPVLNSSNNILIDSKNRALHTEKSILLGIHSAEHIVDKEPLSLNVVWYPNVIIEIIENK